MITRMHAYINIYLAGSLCYLKISIVCVITNIVCVIIIIVHDFISSVVEIEYLFITLSGIVQILGAVIFIQII